MIAIELNIFFRDDVSLSGEEGIKYKRKGD